MCCFRSRHGKVRRRSASDEHLARDVNVPKIMVSKKVEASDCLGWGDILSIVRLCVMKESLACRGKERFLSRYWSLPGRASSACETC